MKFAHLSILGLLAILAGCELIGPKEIARWNGSRRDRAKIVFTSHTQRAPTIAEHTRIDMKKATLRGAAVALVRERHTTVKTARIESPPILQNRGKTEHLLSVDTYAFDANGRTTLPPAKQLEILNLEEIRQALRGSAGLDFDEAL